MLARRFILVLVFVLAVLLPGAIPVAAGTRTPFTVNVSSITPVMFELWTVEDVTTPGGNTHLLHSVEVYTFTSDDPRYGAEGTVVTFDYHHFLQKQEHPAPFWGPGDGDWWVEVNGQRTWEGTFHLLQRAQYLTVEYVGHGVGIYEGLQLQMVNYWDNVDFTKWSVTGEILDPKGK